MCNAVFLVGLGRGHLVVGVELQLLVRGDGEDGVRAPGHGVGDAAARLATAAPLIRKDDSLAVVGEVGGVPEGVVGIGDGIEALGMFGVPDVQQDAVTGTRAGGQAKPGVSGDVVAASSGRGCLRAITVVAALPQAVHIAGLGIGEDARAGNHLGQFRMRDWHLDDDDGKKRGIGILVRIAAGTAAKLGGGTDPRGAGDVDVDIVLVLGVDHEGVGVGATAGLNVNHLLWVVNIGDVEDPNALHAVRAGRRLARPKGSHGRSIGGSVAGRSRWLRLGTRSGKPWVPQSMRPLAASTDMNRRFL